MRRRELSIRWTLRDSSDTCPTGPPYTASPVRGPWDLIQYISLWAAEIQEVAVVILLSSRMHILGYREVGRGSSTSCPMDVKEVFRAALMGGAFTFILCHNHPSGSVEPSADDLTVTGRIKAVGDLLGIPILDHIIVGAGSDGQLTHYSMRDHGKL